MDLNAARKRLTDVLGDDSKKYFIYMKNWFRQKISKEEFDAECRKLLKADQVHLHNEFLLCILNKCHSLTLTCTTRDAQSESPSITKDKLKKEKQKNKKVKLTRASFDHRFQAIYPLLACPQMIPHEPVEGANPMLCVKDGMLPDISSIHGRMFLTAWELGLDDVQDETVQLMMIAVENILKAILMAVFSRRRAYRIRENKFIHAMGTCAPDPYLRNTRNLFHSSKESYATDVNKQGDHVPSIKPSSDWAEQEALHTVACSAEPDGPLPPVSLWDLFETLQVHRHILASHSIYSINMERIASQLWHPGHDELEAKDILRKQDEILSEVGTTTKSGDDCSWLPAAQAAMRATSGQEV